MLTNIPSSYREHLQGEETFYCLGFQVLALVVKKMLNPIKR